jgi:hypothetical protein
MTPKFGIRKTVETLPRWENCNLSQWNRWVATDFLLDHSSPLGINGLHCIKCLHQMGKLLLNLTLGESLSLMKKLPCFDNPINFDSLLVGVLCLGFHDPINYLLFDVVRIEFCRGQLAQPHSKCQERRKIGSK